MISGPRASQNEDEAFEKACAEFERHKGHSFKELMETYSRAFKFPSKAVAAKFISQLAGAPSCDPEIINIAGDLLVKGGSPTQNSGGDVAMRAAKIIFDLRRELAKLKGT